MFVAVVVVVLVVVVVVAVVTIVVVVVAVTWQRDEQRGFLEQIEDLVIVAVSVKKQRA